MQSALSTVLYRTDLFLSSYTIYQDKQTMWFSGIADVIEYAFYIRKKYQLKTKVQQHSVEGITVRNFENVFFEGEMQQFKCKRNFVFNFYAKTHVKQTTLGKNGLCQSDLSIGKHFRDDPG